MHAEKAGRALAGSGAAAIYTSPLGRARETAEIIAKPHRLWVTADEAFEGVSFGVWEGLTAEEVGRTFSVLHGAWRDAPQTVRFPGGEDLATARARALRGIERLQAAHPQETVVVVGRGLTMIVEGELVLEEWVKSPPYWPTTEAVPVAVPEKFAVHVDVPAVMPADRVQLAVKGVMLPVPVKLTIPLGVVGVPEVSVRVAVHVDP